MNWDLKMQGFFVFAEERPLGSVVLALASSESARHWLVGEGHDRDVVVPFTPLVLACRTEGSLPLGWPPGASSSPSVLESSAASSSSRRAARAPGGASHSLCAAARLRSGAERRQFPECPPAGAGGAARRPGLPGGPRGPAAAAATSAGWVA